MSSTLSSPRPRPPEPVRVACPMQVLLLLLANLFFAPSPPAQPRSTPIVFVHGGVTAGDSFATQVQRFSSNGYAWDDLHVFDWNGVGPNFPSEALEAFVEAVRRSTGAARVHLIAHSRGGGLCYDFLSDGRRRALVDRYVHAGSFRPGGVPGPANDAVPTLNLWSPGDLIAGSGDIPGATNVSLPGLDHLQIALGPLAFAEMYRYLNGGRGPRTTEVLRESMVFVAGRAITFGSNQGLAGVPVSVYEVDPASGARRQLAAAFVTDAAGRWGPFRAAARACYEFHLAASVASEQGVHLYREPFVRSNPVVYLREFQPLSIYPGLQTMPRDDRPLLGNLTHNAAVIAGRDSLTFNGMEIATPQIAPAARTLVAEFLWDADGDGQSDLTTNPLFDGVFLEGIDLAPPPGTVEVVYNGRMLRALVRPSRLGITMTQFD